MRIGVNLSLRQFQKDNLVEKVQSILLETGLAPEYLELEITESIAMNAMMEMGIRLACREKRSISMPESRQLLMCLMHSAVTACTKKPGRCRKLLPILSSNGGNSSILD